MPTLDEIRAKILAEENKFGTKDGQKSSGGDNSFYAFWNTPEGSQTVLRFLPDGDSDNIYFWKEKLHINLTFNGIKGQSHDTVTVRVPCMEMYEGEKCPILAEIRPWWKDPALTELARKYWKKKSYLFQGFVVESGFEEQNPPTNPIRKFSISPGVFEKVKSGILDRDFEDNPTDYIGGRNFRLKKTKKGTYANYDNSVWVPKVESLTEKQLLAIEEHGLNNLSDLLPRKPTADEQAIIMEMFKDSVDEKAFDMDKYGSHYKPFGATSSAPSAPRIAESAPAASLPQSNSEQEDSGSTSGSDIASILARVNASRS